MVSREQRAPLLAQFCFQSCSAAVSSASSVIPLTLYYLMMGSFLLRVTGREPVLCSRAPAHTMQVCVFWAKAHLFHRLVQGAMMQERPGAVPIGDPLAAPLGHGKCPRVFEGNRVALNLWFKGMHPKGPTAWHSARLEFRILGLINMWLARSHFHFQFNSTNSVTCLINSH